MRAADHSRHGRTWPRAKFLMLILLAGGVALAGHAADRDPTSSTPASGDAKDARFFDLRIAPILGRHCVECHGPAKAKARLDLSRKDAAFSGGKSGAAIVPGRATESLLWKNVESGEMPEDRPPLPAEQKKLLREWIDAGAVWPDESETAPLAHAPDRTLENTWARRLTVPEYIQTVRDAVGVDIESEARQILPRDLRADGFHNTAYNLNVDLAHVEAYARLSQIIVERMNVETFVKEHANCRQMDDACLSDLVPEVGRWLLRGPLEAHEVAAFQDVAKAVTSQGGDFKAAAGYVIEAMLQSPRFLYRIERPATDRKSPRVAGYELASRVSYILWGGPPDKELMRAAEAGELMRTRSLEVQVKRMLRDPRAVARSLQFVHEWLDLDRLSHLRPDSKKFPNWDPRLAQDMREETVAFFQHVAWDRKQPLSDLMNARVVFATPRLAAHYGLRPDLSAGESRDGLEALYTFEEGSGEVIHDVSGAAEPGHLKIDDLSAVKWGRGRLVVRKAPVLIATPTPPKRIITAIRKSQAMTLEAWVTPGSLSQKGPARIVTLSSGASARNFTLGQQESEFEVRFRTTKSNENGLPGLSSSAAAILNRLTHVVYTRDTSGKATLYVDGENRGSRSLAVDLSNWDDGFQLALANETTRDRPWQGTFHRVAIYSRALSAAEIQSRSERLSRYELDAKTVRGGLLTQGSALTIGGDNASMVTRGLFVLRDFLWAEVDSPPAGVDTTPVPVKPGLSQRAIAENRLANASCGGCHAKFEPFAFGLERFDGLGTYRRKDAHGNDLRDDGEIVFPGTDQAVAYQSASELMNILAANDRVRKGITRKLTQFALGRPLVGTDERSLDQIHDAAWQGGGTYPSLITAIVMSDLVRGPRAITRR